MATLTQRTLALQGRIVVDMAIPRLDWGKPIAPAVGARATDSTGRGQ